MDPTGLKAIDGTLLRDVLVALLAAGGLVWFIGNRIGKFKKWVKSELMGDAEFIKAIGEEVERRIKSAFLEHENREVERSNEFEKRVERRLVQFASHLTILEGKMGLLESKLDSSPPKHSEG